MRAFGLFAALYAVLLMGGCTTAKPPQPNVPSQAADVASRLNERFNNAVQDCGVNQPAYECSGVLIRRSTYNPNVEFWKHSEAAKALGSVTFSFLRTDANTTFSDASGYVLMDKLTSDQAIKTWPAFRCIYPFIATTQNVGRPLNGCGFIPTANDQSTCAGLVDPAVTPEKWIANFVRFGSNPRNQCSLSTENPEQFITSLRVREYLPDQSGKLLNEVLLATWNEEAPEKLPVEAFFYNAAFPGSLINAQALRHTYKIKTGQTLPIVRLDFKAATSNRFSLRPQDQEGGWEVAERLNARFQNRDGQCADGRAPVYCSGVLARATEPNPPYHVWNPKPDTKSGVAPKPSATPKPDAVGAVSFSYLRADIHTPNLFTPQGLLFGSLGYPSDSGIEAITPTCIYMADSNTWQRPDLGCGPNNGYYPVDSGPCASMGINDLTALTEHYLKEPADPTWKRINHQCSLAIEPTSFMLSIQGRATLIKGNESSYHGYNEIMLKSWPQDIPDRLPLDAIFYAAAGGAAALGQAKLIQQDLFKHSADLVKPIVRVELGAVAPGFTYRREDQSY
ncbi:hypothetical protein ACIQUF_22460 [Pseudomonas sp. NPDC090233]|uniref:hypothetical protein n=1 Tax=Pseudomonas sp. NPDC090233 TaxID=3364479 RepID=UPI00383A34EB